MFASKQVVSTSLRVPILTRSICHKSELKHPKVYHWPYEKKSWGLHNFFLDPFTRRKLNENSKVIQIEGNIASGKHDFADRLADELGMKHMPDVDLESYYVNDYGYDYRALNPLLPERLRACDWGMFHENPSRHSVVHLQYFMFKLRLLQYIRAVQHIYNTGQGVILSRSVFTERVFVEAMHDLGWLPHGYLRGDGIRFYDWKLRYNFIRNLSLVHIPKPHLTIYLDTPIDTCMDRIKNSENPMIANSKALIPEYLEAIERAYRDVVLPKQDLNGHVIEYDYPKAFNKDEMMDVVDDIKALDFNYDFHDTRFEDWDGEAMAENALAYFYRRRHYTTMKVMDFFDPLEQPYFDIAGLGDSVSQAELEVREGLRQANTGELGHYIAKESNPKFSSLFSVLFNKMSYDRQLNKAIRSDFL